MQAKPERRKKTMNTRKTYLILSLYFIGFGILVAFLTSFVNYQMQVTNVDDALSERFTRVKESKLEFLKVSMASLDATLDSVAQNPTTFRYLSNPSENNRQVLQDLILATTVAEPEYMQVRLISDIGMELIRVDRDAKGKLTVVPEENLQDKSERYYFKEAIKHSQTPYWYSRLDLNVEKGKIEQPIRPTLRVATPVKMLSGKNGLVIVNVDVSAILASLSLSPDFLVYLKDKEGQILHHPSEKFAWSRYLDDRVSLPPVGEHAFELPLETLLSNGEGITMVMVPKTEVLQQITQNNLLTAAIIAGIVLFISFPLSWLIALLPTRLQRQLAIALGQLQRTSSLLDKHLISSHTDTNGVITNVSERMCSVSEYSRIELIGQKHSLLKHRNADAKAHDSLWRTISAGKTWKGEFHNVSKRGNEYWLRSIITPEYNEADELIGYMQIAQEVTARKKLEHLSVTDALTQLYNRRKLDQVLSDEMHRFCRYHHTFTVVLIDLDHFKSVNDTWGHQAGDETLVSVAEAIRNTLRKVDYAGRWGGEEFLIVCPNTDLSGAYLLANKLRKAIEILPFELGYSVTASFGVAASEKAESVNGLLARADRSLYEAKLGGRNRVVINQGDSTGENVDSAN